MISIIIGTSFYYAKQKGRIARELMLSASNLFYHANGFIVNILNIGIIFITANYAANLKNFKDYPNYTNSITFFLAWTIIILFVILPTISYRLTKSFKMIYKGIFVSFQNIIFFRTCKRFLFPLCDINRRY